MPKAIQLVGRRFFRLKVIEFAGRNKSKNYTWKCLCDCGKEVVVASSNLLTGNSKSCGCYDIETLVKRSKKHGLTKTRIYKIWVGIRKRCTNPKMKSYAEYGGRGIKVCDRWNDFENFYEDMKIGYSDELSLERKDPNGNYEPDNCKWATMKEQARNKRNTKRITLGDESRTASEWEEISGTGRCTIAWRLKNGWDTHRAIYGDPVSNLSEISKYLVF